MAKYLFSELKFDAFISMHHLSKISIYQKIFDSNLPGISDICTRFLARIVFYKHSGSLMPFKLEKDFKSISRDIVDSSRCGSNYSVFALEKYLERIKSRNHIQLVKFQNLKRKRNGGRLLSIHIDKDDKERLSFVLEQKGNSLKQFFLNCLNDEYERLYNSSISD